MFFVLLLDWQEFLKVFAYNVRVVAEIRGDGSRAKARLLTG